MKKIIKNHIVQAAALAAMLCFAAGCATQSGTARRAYYFFPPPPNEPRLQFLMGFSSDMDLRGGEDRSLMSFVTGVEPPNEGFGKPYGAAVHDKKLYICDTDVGAVLVADLQGKRIGVLDAQGEGALSMPLNIAIDDEGSCYIADAGREQVIIFDKDGNYAGAIGKLGEMKPRDVAVNANRIYVVDIQNQTVHVYDKASRNLLFNIPRDNDRTNQMHCLYIPTNLALDSKGWVFVADTGACHVQVYDADGKYVRTIGRLGDAPGQFARIKGVAVDRDNRLYAVDSMSGVIQMFDENGQLLTWFGDPAGALFQSLPTKVLVDYDDVGLFQSYAAPHFKLDHLVIVINQFGPHKASIYGFGQMK
jgi:DNA-binding beta-propeller fold protein YncE